jgi:hypothetical protein
LKYIHFICRGCNISTNATYAKNRQTPPLPPKKNYREAKIPLRRGVLDATLCDKVYQSLATGRWFSSGIPVSSTNETDRHDIAEILLKVALNRITLTLTTM